VAERLVEEILLLNVVKSVEERKPFVEAFAWEMVKTPVPELYASGVVAESDVEPILLLKFVKSVEKR
jgi:hypothetical protein